MSGYERITEDQHADEAPSQHTPGPWEISRRKKYKVEISDAARGWTAFASVYVALDDGLGNPIPSQEGEANARLIAAAPELLIACRTAWAFLSPRRDNSFAMSALEIVEAAIAKAEGRS